MGQTLEEFDAENRFKVIAHRLVYGFYQDNPIWMARDDILYLLQVIDKKDEEIKALKNKGG